MTDASKLPGRAAPTRLDRLVGRARRVVSAERVWPALVLAGVALAVFVALSWLGLWVIAPRPLRIAGVAALAAALGYAAFIGVRGLRVTRAEALARLDRDSGLAHRPVSSVEDRLANAGGDPLTRALWDLSRRRLDEVLARIRLRPPALRLVERDPYALRSLALVGLVAAGFVAGEHKDGLVAAAFDWRGAAGSAAGFRVDAWVDPPAYTGKPPVVLLAGSIAAPREQAVAVPIHSSVVVRSSGEGALAVNTTGGVKTAPPPATAVPATAVPATAVPKTAETKTAETKTAEAKTAEAKTAPAAGEQRFGLDGDGRITLTHEGDPLGVVALTAIPDRPPTIALVGKPEPTDRGGLTIAYRIDDDYGVVAAEAAFTDPTVPDQPLVRSLVPPPRLALNLPPTPGGLGPGRTTGDLSDSPWAGAEVTATLSAKDEGGNVGLSAPFRMRLPARPFSNPLARALVEQRRDLVFDPDHRDGVATALDALMVDPDAFHTSKAVYLGLYTARERLTAARSDDDLIALSDYLWQMALHIEEGDMSASARDLKAAEQALREALQRGASPEEIKRLTEALRQQMDKFLAEMAKTAQTARNEPPNPNTRTVTQNDLQQMMKRMEEMAQSGDTAEAQRMLDQLQAMLDNLKTAKNGRANQAQREMNRQMGELDKMTREQQAVRDRTFKQGRQARRPQDGAQSVPDDQDDDDTAQAGPQPGQDGARPDDQQADQGAGQGGGQDLQEDLQGQQQALRQRLGELRERMRQLGLKGEKGLDDAEKAMGEAGDALGQGPGANRKAVDAQGRALQGLQQGANGLAQQMAEAGQGNQTGEVDGEGSGGQSISQGSAGDEGRDPLGRPRENRGFAEAPGKALDESVAARAQRVLQELRRRLGDPNRPSEELDYLQRLLQPY